MSPPSTRPWDPLNDLIQFEKDGCIQTKVRHRTPMVRSGSLISLSNQGPRRDNCKYQVGHPGQTPPPLSSFHKEKATHPLNRLPCRSCCSVITVASSHSAAITAAASAPLGLALFTETCSSVLVRKMWLKNPFISFLYLIRTHLPVASRVFVIAKIRNHIKGNHFLKCCAF